MSYVDGFVIPMPKSKIPAYRKLARLASKVWMDHGALQYIEAVGDDLTTPCGPGFVNGIGAKKGEAIVFAWVLYKSKAHRDRVNKKVMADPRLTESMTKKMPFDPNRMLYAGFKTLVSAEASGR